MLAEQRKEIQEGEHILGKYPMGTGPIHTMCKLRALQGSFLLSRLANFPSLEPAGPST